MYRHQRQATLKGVFIFLALFASIFADAGVVINKKYAILVGINAHRITPSPPETMTEVDLMESACLLRNFEPTNIQKFVNANATENNVMEALDQVIAKAAPGDVVCFYFAGFTMVGAGLPMYDFLIGSTDPEGKGSLGRIELSKKLNQLSKSVTQSGQVVVCFDVMFQSKASKYAESSRREEWTRAGLVSVSESSDPNNILFFGESIDSSIQMGRNKVQLWTYAFTETLKNSDVTTWGEVDKAIITKIGQFGFVSEDVWFIGVKSIPCFKKHVINEPESPVAGLNKDANFYVISIGIDQYNIPGFRSDAFSNCTKDAVRFTSTISHQFEKYHKGAQNKIVRHELLNEKATLENIQAAINNVINQAGKGDYFFFNFAGFTSNGKDSKGKEEIYFHTYSTNLIEFQQNQLKTIPIKDVVSLRRLKDLLIFIPCQNQLIVSEAGSSESFTKMLTKAMIETSPSIMEIEMRNRVIIVPRGYGLNSTSCGQNTIQAGPIAYYLSEIGSQQHLLNLFSTSQNKRQAMAYEFLRMETNCGLGRPYVEIFFERDVVETLQFYMGDVNISGNRGATTSSVKLDSASKSSFGNKYALCIGSNDYLNGRPTWQDLKNPISDAKRIGDLLSTLYGYEVVFLENPSANEVIRALQNISLKLSEKDQFICFIAGHGDYDPNFFDDGFIVLSESLSQNKDPYRRTYLPFSTIGNILDNLKCNQVLLLVDVCFGGAFDQKVKNSVTRSKLDGYGDMAVDDMMRIKSDKRTRIVMSSGSLNEVPDGYNGKHSPFAAMLIMVLESDGGTRGVLTTSQLYDKVQFLPSLPFRGDLMSNEPGSEFFIISTRILGAKN